MIHREVADGLERLWNVRVNCIWEADESSRHGEVYIFDHVFNQECTNSDVYGSVVKPLVDSFMEGFNATIFAYGQTSSGKTHTILGNKTDPGLFQLVSNQLFQHVADQVDKRYLIRCSYIEIYNEKINDLLDKSNQGLTREDIKGNVLLDAREAVVDNVDKVMENMMQGNKIRRVAATRMNERSSRSHTIFRIILESKDANQKDGPVHISYLNLMDLAGSERVSLTKAAGERLKEGANINKSLSVLGNVIRQLSEGKEFISYRDSKLTRLLSQALGGNAKSLIIGNIRPMIHPEVADGLERLWNVRANCIWEADESSRHGEVYIFDHECTNSDVYGSVVKPLVVSFMEGFNATIFAYGQTSSGKTHTILGNETDPGLFQLVSNQLFQHVADQVDKRYLIRCSYIEIYNEKINDLLDKSNQGLTLREDIKGNVLLDAREPVVDNVDKVMENMMQGNKIRRVAATRMNERSSRSHTIFRIILESKDANQKDGPVHISYLNLMDLAGSERVSLTKAAGNVIRQLSEGKEFISYRDSKLTRLLSQALGGNAKSLIIGNECTNSDVYGSVVKPLVDSFMEGFNATIFAYGQTSSGKTHTILGNKTDPGLFQLVSNQLFQHVADQVDKRYLIRCSYIEIYNEKINDLLDKSNQGLTMRRYQRKCAA
ncbi:unnamed protein product [Acanthoscelides obtectus]|uniref:Kinesin motor domain-containing protein n=1 Tax=Acanthoscelides obtectus TaxID=200917 RepID=A0A9P0VT84_ACAOB|nr:unnamed protein product [Acanthoscelides obtectus]CAK1682856.1 Centromere-associated protein E [Acanthoscelides obtectus]